jgi:hypothetical protein
VTRLARRYASRTKGPSVVSNRTTRALPGVGWYPTRNARRLAGRLPVAWYGTRNAGAAGDHNMTIPLPGGSRPASSAPRIPRGPIGSIARRPGARAAKARRLARVSDTRRTR